MQAPGQLVNLTPRIRSLYPDLPREFCTQLHRYETDIRLSNTQPSTKIIGLFEFLALRPMFSLELFAIYRYCRITAVKVTADVTNQGTVPIMYAIGVLPWAAISATGSPMALMERPRSAHRVVAGSGGMSRAVVTKLYHSFDELGNPVYDQKYWFDVTQAASTTPQDSDEPAIAVALGAVDETSTWNAASTYHITYHCQFFELNYADVVPDPNAMDEESFEDKKRPPPKRVVRK